MAAFVRKRWSRSSKSAPKRSKFLAFPKVTDPEAPPIRPTRHVPNSITTIRRRLTVALARSLPRCPSCVTPSRQQANSKWYYGVTMDRHDDFRPGKTVDPSTAKNSFKYVVLTLTDDGNEIIDLHAQGRRFIGQTLGCREYPGGTVLGRYRATGDAADDRRDLGGSDCGAVGIARDFLGRGALLFDRRGDRRRDLADDVDRPADLPDRPHRIVRGVLHGGDLAADLVGRAPGLVGEALHLIGHDREALAGV